MGKKQRNKLQKESDHKDSIGTDSGSSDVKGAFGEKVFNDLARELK